MIGDWPKSFFIYETIIWILLVGIPFFIFFHKKRVKKKKKGKEKKKLNFFLILLWGVVFYGSFIEPRILIVRELTKEIPNLPPLKIAIVSDIHIGPYKKDDWVQKIISEINNIPDIDMVLMPGDFLFGGVGKYGKYLEPLKKSQYPIYAVLGNHDHGETEVRDEYQAKGASKVLKEVGVKELKNQAIFLENKNIWIVGVDDNYYGFHSLSQAFESTDSHPQILLAHSPDIMDDLSKEDYKPNLVVSGHTHAGQNRIPFIGAVPFTIPTENGKKLEKDWYERNGISLFVTSGAGEVGPRARFLNPPEIVILKINQK